MKTLYQQIKTLKESGQFDWLESVSPMLYHQLNYQFAIYDWLVTHHLLHQSGSYEKAWEYFYQKSLLQHAGVCELSKKTIYKAIATMERVVPDEYADTQPTRKRIYDAIRQQPDISVKELSLATNTPERTVQYYLSKLSQQGYIRRENNNRKGKLEILS